ncbi:MAG: type II secretion system F family protein [Candidatus Diapherotrites archaeon]|nr:type II secretion system F family protein [Candidatus Diapherotrites archaeon]
MITTKKYGLLSYYIFQRQLKYILPYFQNLKQTLYKADMGVSLEEYVTSFLLTTTLICTGMLITTSYYLSVVLKIELMPLIFWELIILLATAGAIFAFYFNYPEYKVGELTRNLNKHVAFAATHMATIAGTGVPPHVIFQMVGDFTEYGEVASTCAKVYRNVVVFGYDTLSAVSEEAQKTPSHKFKDLLWSIVATIRTGGNLRQMLIAKSKTLMEDQRRVEAEYVETLSMMAEIYSTVFVAGIVMVFVLVAIMGILGGLPVPVKLVLEITTYLGVPLASIAFITVIETSKPAGL